MFNSIFYQNYFFKKNNKLDSITLFLKLLK